jgi:outer membrane protein OmpA-like peptidoglycan-associated protein
MPKIPLLLAFSLSFGLIQAQNKLLYSDFTPTYRVNYDYYILDKIDYYEDRMVVFFRFVCDLSLYTGATFYTKGGQYPWFLKSKTPRRDFDLIEIRNIRVDEKLVMEKATKPNQSIPPNKTAGYAVYTCEVHFPRPPKEITKVDLIEGKGKEDSNNFNCFDILVKHPEDKNLGSVEERQRKIVQFEEKFGITNNKIPPSPQTETKTQEQPKAENIQPPSPGSAKTLRSDKELDCGQVLHLDYILFKDNSTDFQSTPQAKAQLELLRQYLLNHDKASVVIYGHTDIFGKAERNQELSEHRAQATMRYLLSYGVPARKVKAQGMGSTQPLFPEGNPKNRRIEVKIQCN